MNINELYGLKRNERYKALEALSDSELKTLAKKLFNELFPLSNLNEKIDSDDRENLIESIVKITSASSKGITQTQKYDPFAITNETHCGDCNKLLSKNGRIEEAYFQEGVRCKQCHELFVKHNNELKILIGELNDIIKTQPLNASNRLRDISQHLIRIANELDMPETVKNFMRDKT